LTAWITIQIIKGGLLFAKAMRDKGYSTMLDPLQQKYGSKIGGILFFPAIIGDTLWLASILNVIGNTETMNTPG